ncbi:MAG: hypothetical protein M1818_008102 [Claussenomyces sp. TS43310]|nr:MAG: hypothetical protein M1818_008102 [Claussenomyces sp. TS43310]
MKNFEAKDVPYRDELVQNWLNEITQEGRPSGVVFELPKKLGMNAQQHGHRASPQRTDIKGSLHTQIEKEAERPHDARHGRRQQMLDSSPGTSFLERGFATPQRYRQLKAAKHHPQDTGTPNDKLRKRQGSDSLSYVSRNSSLSSRPRKEVFERRKRHRTREDRYDSNKRKLDVEDGKKVKRDEHRKKKRRRRNAVRKAGHNLMQTFSSRSIGNDRLTDCLEMAERQVQLEEEVVMPDLVFSEMQFLQNSIRPPNEARAEHSVSKSRDKDNRKIQRAQDEISSFFKTKKRSFTEIDTRTQSQRRKSSFEDHQGRLGDYGRDHDKNPLSSHSLDVSHPVSFPSKLRVEAGHLRCRPAASGLLRSSPQTSQEPRKIPQDVGALSGKGTTYCSWSDRVTSPVVASKPFEKGVAQDELSLTPEDVRVALERTGVYKDTGIRGTERRNRNYSSRRNVDSKIGQYRQPKSKDEGIVMMSRRSDGVRQQQLEQQDFFHGQKHQESDHSDHGSGQSKEQRPQKGVETVEMYISRGSEDIGEQGTKEVPSQNDSETVAAYHGPSRVERKDEETQTLEMPSSRTRTPREVLAKAAYVERTRVEPSFKKAAPALKSSETACQMQSDHLEGSKPDKEESCTVSEVSQSQVQLSAKSSGHEDSAQEDASYVNSLCATRRSQARYPSADCIARKERMSKGEKGMEVGSNASSQNADVGRGPNPIESSNPRQANFSPSQLGLPIRGFTSQQTIRPNRIRSPAFVPSLYQYQLDEEPTFQITSGSPLIGCENVRWGDGTCFVMKNGVPDYFGNGHHEIQTIEGVNSLANSVLSYEDAFVSREDADPTDLWTWPPDVIDRFARTPGADNLVDHIPYDTNSCQYLDYDSVESRQQVGEEVEQSEDEFGEFWRPHQKY